MFEIEEATIMRISLYALCTLCLAAFLAPGSVVADEDSDASTPIKLSTAQMDQITAGVGRLGRGNDFGAGAGSTGWFGGPPGTEHGLFSAGFTPGDLNPNNPMVVVPGPKDG